MRWQAPEHVTCVHLVSGSLEVKDGHVEAPDALGAADISGLRANGFVLAPAETPVADTPADSDPET